MRHQSSHLGVKILHDRDRVLDSLSGVGVDDSREGVAFVGLGRAIGLKDLRDLKEAEPLRLVGKTLNVQRIPTCRSARQYSVRALKCLDERAPDAPGVGRTAETGRELDVVVRDGLRHGGLSIKKAPKGSRDE